MEIYRFLKRRVRFSTRFILLGTFVVAVSLSLVASLVYRTEKQREAVHWIRMHDRHVYYDYSIGKDAKLVSGAKSSFPDWFQSLLPEDYRQTVEMVVLDQDRRVEKLSVLKGLTGIRHLSSNSTNVHDLKGISGLRSLERLSVHDNPISDLTPIADLKNLVFLRASETRVRELDAIKGLGKLKVLLLANTDVDQLTALKDLGNLEFLDISNTQVRSLAPIEQLGLKTLVIAGLEIPSKDVENFKGSNPNCRIVKWKPSWNYSFGGKRYDRLDYENW